MSSSRLSVNIPKPHAGVQTKESLLSNDIPHVDDDLPRDNRAGLISRLGKFSAAVLLSSFPVSLGCVAFFTFLWAADSDNAVWRKIVLSGWTTRSITISSLALRWATAAQAVTCTSMLAAILLQEYAVPLPNAAAVSILRFDNTGPWLLLGRMKGSWHQKTVPIAILAAMISLTTLSLQFTSTVLLSQVGPGPIPVPSSFSQTLYGLDPDGNSFASQLHGATHSYLETTPQGFPAFAEWVSNATTSDTSRQHGEFPPNSAPGLRDTGSVLRAFLPINSSDDRNHVTDYKGFATAVDMRVVCIRPTLTDVEFSGGNGFRVTGRSDIAHNPAGLFYSTDAQESDKFSAAFDCGFAASASKNYDPSGWPLSLCSGIGYQSVKGIYSVMDAKGNETLGPAYLLINATMNDTVTDMDDSDLWESISIKASDMDERVSLQFTVCLTAFEPQELEIHATRPSLITPEPALSWDTSTGTYKTGAILRQLGAGESNSTTSNRAIFNLAPRSWQFAERPESIEITGAAYSTTYALEALSYSTEIYWGMINTAQYSILAQMAAATADPALAVQAFFTTLFATVYYDRLIMFDTAAPSDHVYLVQVLRPLGWTAFTIVVAIVVSHLLLVLFTILLFCKWGKLSRLGNSWVAISQVLGPTTEDWIRKADMLDDKRVRIWLKSRGMDKELVRIEDADTHSHRLLIHIHLSPLQDFTITTEFSEVPFLEDTAILLRLKSTTDLLDLQKLFFKVLRQLHVDHEYAIQAFQECHNEVSTSVELSTGNEIDVTHKIRIRIDKANTTCNERGVSIYREQRRREVSRNRAFPVTRHRQWLVPFGRNQDLVGRREVMDRLFELIPPSAEADHCQRTAIKGLGGMGRTQMALEAAFLVRDQDPDCSIFWVSAADETSFESAYREIGRKLQVARVEDEKADVKLLVKKAMGQESCGRWLLIIDNADDVELVFGTARLCDSLPP